MEAFIAFTKDETKHVSRLPSLACIKLGEIDEY